MTRTMPRKKGFEMPLTRKAIESDSLRFKYRAESLGTKPYSSMTAMIFFFVSGLMSG